jgi:adenine-specific DNA-methyltransferase
MYPRLFLAKNLLKDDGVIFISIDDNEVHNLRLLINEIFGEENFVGEISWQKKTQPSFLSKKISIIKEYILFYQKQDTNLTTMGDITDTDKLVEMINISNEISCRILKKENILFSNGNFSGTLKAGQYGNGQLQIKLLNDCNIINGIPKENIKLLGRFKWTQETMNTSFIAGDLYHIKSINSLRPTVERKNKIANIKPILDMLSKKLDSGIPTNTDATNEIKDLFDGHSIINYPKPVGLIKYIIKSITFDDKDSITLDFFAGSGTTAQAVMELNKDDGGNRKFICVQLPEKTEENSEAFKAGYKTIAEISKERIRRAAKKIETKVKEESFTLPLSCEGGGGAVQT